MEMPLAHRLRHSSCSAVKCVVNDATFSEGLATDNDFSIRLTVMVWLIVTKAIMPCAKRAPDDQRTSGSFLGTNELFSTVGRVNSVSPLLDRAVGDGRAVGP